MKIEIKLFYDLAQFLPPGSTKNTGTMDLDEGTTVQDLIELLKLPSDLPKSIIVNGITAKKDTVLKDNDSVAVFPPMAGG
jgi:molybdopterin synthase sulfur carrier subunit